MKHSGLFIFIMTLLLAFSCFGATTYYVDDDAPSDPGPGDPAISDPCEDGSTAHPFDAIEEGRVIANTDDTVMVRPGTYTGTGNRDINFHGKAITIQSTDPCDPAVVAATIIDCQANASDRHRGFIFYTQEDANSVVAGLTITNGYAPEDLNTGWSVLSAGGAITCWANSNPTITNCIITNNSAEGATAGVGGGICCYESSPTISHCIITNNWANGSGGGVGHMGEALITLQSCTKISHCTIVGNSAGNGGAIYTSRTSSISRPEISNCIIWANTPNQIVWDGIFVAPVVTYNDVQGGWTGAGVGNIDSDPCFVDAPCADFHLKSQAGRYNPNTQSWVADSVTSLCIDAGDPADPVGLEPFPNGGIINMGAYGGTAQASKSYFGEPVCNTIVAGDINGDCIVNLLDLVLMSTHWLEDYSP